VHLTTLRGEVFQVPGNEAADGLPACGLYDRGRLAPLFVEGQTLAATVAEAPVTRARGLRRALGGAQQHGLDLCNQDIEPGVLADEAV
jgi:hypothetical protein